MWETYSVKKKKETKRKKKKKEKLFYVFTTMTSLSAVDNLECNNAGNKSVQNCKKYENGIVYQSIRMITMK